MGKIALLAEHEVQKIAAGEVVERPANVVKELLENALDAQATHLTLFVEEGGKKSIRLIDNGCGMSEEDAHQCILPHATSKIKSVNELETLTTFGFRGEALSSISAVSEITLITQEKDAPVGTQLVIEYGKLQYSTQVSRNPGTDITINHLFENVPVRKKFLKTTETEWRAIIQLFQAFCLAYPEVHFQLYHNNQIIYNCPTATLKERITQLFGYSIESALIPFSVPTGSEYTITGMITQPVYQRYDRSQLFFFVNKRWIKNYKLSQALLKGYAQALTPGKYPAAFIFITIEPHLIDINIHPRKEEVQFLYPRKIEMSLEHATKKTLEQNVSHILQPSSSLISSQFPEPAPRFFSEKDTFTPASLLKDINAPIKQSFQPLETAPFLERKIEEPLSALQPVTESLASGMTNYAIPSTTQEFRIIGQLHNTYLLIETEKGLALIDQHAAHERVLYALFATRFQEVARLSLLFPLYVRLSEPELTTFMEYKALFEEHGFEFHEVGPLQLAFTTVPAPLKEANIIELIQQTIITLRTFPEKKGKEVLHHTLQAQMACKGAVKAGDVLTNEQMQELLQTFMTTENNSTCPHGRPTLWHIVTAEIERKFKRI